ncbi:MAG: UvrD-helicase domain-containing protein, partial [Panacagrimonas sp.]
MIGVLVVTHGSIGEALLTSASQILGSMPQQVATLSVWRQDDPDDLVLRARELVAANRAVREEFQRRFRHFFVDEFQDMNPAQFRLLRAWLGDRPDLCVVGDEDQAIYGFTGADASYLLGFATHFPGAAVVRLEANFRSSPQVLAVAHAVLPAGKGAGRPLRPTLSDGPLPEVVAYATDAEEAAGVARALQDAHGPGVAWSSMAVLY